MYMSGQLEILEQIPTFNGDIATDEAARRKVSRDASIFEVMPAGVISPRDTDDIKSVVGWAVRMHEAGMPVHFAPRVGGTCMSGGSLTPHYILDLKSHFNYIGAVDATARLLKRRLPQHLGLRDFFRLRERVEPAEIGLREHRDALGAVAVDPLHGMAFLAGRFHQIPQKRLFVIL